MVKKSKQNIGNNPPEPIITAKERKRLAAAAKLNAMVTQATSADLQQSSSNDQVAQLTKQLEELQAENVNLQKVATDLNQKVIEYVRVENDVIQERRQLHDANEQLNISAQEIQRLNEELQVAADMGSGNSAAVNSEIERLRNALDESRHQFEIAQSELDAEVHDHRYLKATFDSVNSELDQIRLELRGAVSERDHLQQRVDAMETTVGATDDNLRQDILDLNRQLGMHITTEQQLTDRLQSLSDELDKSLQINNALQAENDELKRIAQLRDAQMDDMFAKLDDYQTNENKFTQCINSRDEDIDVLRSQVADLSGKLAIMSVKAETAAVLACGAVAIAHVSLEALKQFTIHQYFGPCAPDQLSSRQATDKLLSDLTPLKLMIRRHPGNHPLFPSINDADVVSKFGRYFMKEQQLQLDYDMANY